MTGTLLSSGDSLSIRKSLRVQNELNLILIKHFNSLEEVESKNWDQSPASEHEQFVKNSLLEECYFEEKYSKHADADVEKRKLLRLNFERVSNLRQGQIEILLRKNLDSSK